MKNKLIRNIVLVYFALLAVVLVVQISGIRNSYVEPSSLSDSIRYRDILSSSVVLCDRSPVMLVKQKQMLVNSDNAALVPIIDGDKSLVPINFFNAAYGAVISSDKNRNSATVRLNNKAMVVDGNEGIITVVSASGEENLKTAGDIEFKGDCAYVPLEGFAEGFDRQLELCGSIALLSEKELKLDENERKDFTSEVESRIKNLPSVGEQERLDELLGSGAVNIFNAIGESIGLSQEKSPVSTLGLDANGIDSPSDIRSDGEYVYFINDSRINIARDTAADEVIGTIQPDFARVYGIYVDGNYLSVVGEGNTSDKSESTFEGCGIDVYDLSDPVAPSKARSVLAEGTYSRAYRKDDVVYLFVRKEANSSDSFDMPDYYDSANASVGEKKSLSEVRFIPEMADKAYTSVLGFNIKDMGRALDITTLLGCGENYSLTGESLYIAADSGKGTSIYRLALNEGNIGYCSAGYVDSVIPDSACMNEYNGVLRVASGTRDRADITLLDSNMDIIDSLEDMPVDGNIVSARFIGSRGYAVSDSTDEPICAAELSDGIEEIGSIGIPADTDAVRNFDAEHFICIKKDGSISMLNIADTEKQYEVFGIQTGGSIDSKAVKLNVNDGILVIPVEFDGAKSYEEQTSEQTTAAVSGEDASAAEETEDMSVTASEEPADDSFVPRGRWQGVFVYRVDTQNGFLPVERISHMDGEYDSAAVIRDVLYKDGKLYTLSDKGVKCSSIID